MSVGKDLRFPFLIVVLSGIVLSLSLPCLPIDETRYLTVAWEMKLHHSFIVPLFNGLPYSHKPPLLFWLINLDWFILGTNENTLRFIPLLFSLLNIAMVYRIALMLWEEKRAVRYATIIFSSTLIYLIWSALIMFDVILTFWVLLGIFGLLSARTDNRRTSWILVGISIGGGLLTKGPVVFIHILPVSILYFLWKPQDNSDTKSWYSGVLLSSFIGIAIALLWVIPAAMMGGKTYEEAILWGQTANRVVSSLAHDRPIWWYIPLLPILLFPWVLVKPAWLGRSAIKQDNNLRFLTVWIVSTILLFSFISGKQIHYLIPVLPAVSLLVAKNIATHCTKIGEHTKWHYPIAIFYIISGVTMLSLPFIKLENDVVIIPVEIVLVSAIAFILLGGVILYMKPSSMDILIKTLALSSSITIIILAFAGKNTLFNLYDMHDISHVLKEKQEAGYDIINYGTYNGQYQFLGHLTQPLVVLKDKKSVSEYMRTHKKVLLITYEKQDKVIDKNDVLYQHVEIDKKVVLWKPEGIHHFLGV